LYIDHWSHTLLWNKVREFGRLLASHAFLADAEDVFFLRPDEVRSALEELRLHWSSGGAGVPRGPADLPPVIERRKTIYEALRRWAPPPALGQAPEAVTEPITIMHWGITTVRVKEWLASADQAPGDTLTGIAGSPGDAASPWSSVSSRPSYVGPNFGIAGGHGHAVSSAIAASIVSTGRRLARGPSPRARELRDRPRSQQSSPAPMAGGCLTPIRVTSASLPPLRGEGQSDPECRNRQPGAGAIRASSFSWRSR
jgi:hypothetical protein